MAVLPNGVTVAEISPQQPMQPSPTDAFIKTLDDESLEFLHDYLLGKLFPRPEKHGMVTITGFGRYQRQPVTFYSTWDLEL